MLAGLGHWIVERQTGEEAKDLKGCGRQLQGHITSTLEDAKQSRK